MAGIYISGGSGTGKTTFCTKMSAHYGVPLIINVIRDIHTKSPYVSHLPRNERQFVYALEYIKVHHSTNPENFLSDRSLLNVLAFWKVQPEVIGFLGLENKIPDLVIILPIPAFSWYQENISCFMDPIRIDTYKQRAGVTKAKLSETDIATLFYEEDRAMFELMKKMCEIVKWPYWVPELDRENPENYRTHWQQQAHNAVVEIWKIRQQIEGGDLDGTESASRKDEHNSDC